MGMSLGGEFRFLSIAGEVVNCGEECSIITGD